MTNKPCIFHIAQTADTDNSVADYQCDSLTLEGFIHCCDRHQLAGVVSRYYQEIDDVVLLVLDVEALEPALIHENTVGGSELFPHVYGPINRSAIIDVIPFGINSIEREGLFS
ncbi:MAG: hypothetical protein ACI9US_002274 [Gammaproteobacteria bacterium]|jgi:uncharacterized protein (DUF952 family)